MRKHLVILFLALAATMARSEDITVKSFSPSSDRAQTLGTSTARWGGLYTTQIADGEGGSFSVSDVGEAVRFSGGKNHNELTAESRAAANSHPIGAVTGLAEALAPATVAKDGSMAAADKDKLDNIDAARIVYYTAEHNIQVPQASALVGVTALAAGVPMLAIDSSNALVVGDDSLGLMLRAAGVPTVTMPNPDYDPEDPESFETATYGLVVSADLESKADLVEGKVPVDQLPVDMIARTWDVATVDDLVTLTDATPGDFARVTTGTDAGKLFTLIADDPAVAANWLDLTDSGGGVISVNGFQGVVNLVLADFPDIVAEFSIKAPLASPALTGAPTAPTPADDDDSARIATTAFVRSAIGTLGGGAVVGDIRLWSFREDELPEGWWFPSGDFFALDSAVGQVLNAFSANFKADWGIVVSGATISLCSADRFFSGTSGRFFRPVIESARTPGSVQSDAIRNITGEWTQHISGGYSLIRSGGIVSGAFGKGSASYSMGIQGSSSSTANPLTFNASNVVPTADENRPYNVGMTPAIYLGVSQ